MDGPTSGTLADQFRGLSVRLSRTGDIATALTDLVGLATVTVPFCNWAGITQVTSRATDRYVTIAASDPLVRTADDLQYRLGEGPCLAAAKTDGLYRADDLAVDQQWPRFAARVTAGTPIRSVYSLTIHPEPVGAALNLYSGGAHVFTPDAVDVATLFAAHAHALLLLIRQTDKVVNLDRALATSRLIGNAVGILMYAHRITADEAFKRLRTASSRLNRKLTDIAAEVTDTGMLPHREPPLPTGGRQ